MTGIRVPIVPTQYQLRLTRFGTEVDTEEGLRQACLWRYAHHYSAEQAPRALAG